MAVYTTQVRTIVESYTEQKRMGASAIDRMVAEAIPFIFSDTWDTYNSDHKSELCAKILEHFYFREIGYETVPLWKFALNRKLNEIMPKYNKMYEIVEKAYINPLNIYDMTEEEQANQNENATTDAQGTSKNSTIMQAGNTSTSEGTSKADSTSNSTAEAWQKYNDTPQGGLQGLDTDAYLTNATKNVSDTDGTTSNTSTSNTTAESDSHSNSETETSNNQSSKGVIERLMDRTRHTHGINGSKSYAELAKQAMEMYINVDMEIIKELEPLFIQLW